MVEYTVKIKVGFTALNFEEANKTTIKIMKEVLEIEPIEFIKADELKGEVTDDLH